MTSTLRTLLWDMDGTLVHSEPLWHEAELELVHSFDTDLPDDVRERMIGMGLWDGAALMQSCGVDLPIDDIVERVVARVVTLIEEREVEWMPGARSLLHELTDSDVTNVLVTMSTMPVAERVVAKLPDGTFDDLVTGEQVARPKPDPLPYLVGAERAGVDIRDCVALEDSRNGLAAAARSGAVSIGIENEVSLDDAAAHVLLSSLNGIHLDHIRQWWISYAGTPPVAGGHVDLRGLGDA